MQSDRRTRAQSQAVRRHNYVRGDSDGRRNDDFVICGYTYYMSFVMGCMMVFSRRFKLATYVCCRIADGQCMAHVLGLSLFVKRERCVNAMMIATKVVICEPAYLLCTYIHIHISIHMVYISKIYMYIPAHFHVSRDS